MLELAEEIVIAAAATVALAVTINALSAVITSALSTAEVAVTGTTTSAVASGAAGGAAAITVATVLSNGTSQLRTFYQVTSRAFAQSNPTQLVGRESSYIYVTSVRPTQAQAADLSARSVETVIAFEAPANAFSADATVQASVQNIALVSNRIGPIPIDDVREAGFEPT